MENSEYGSALEGFYDRLIRLTLDYAQDVQNIENVYLLGSVEDGIVYFKWVYKINGEILSPHELNSISQDSSFSKEKEIEILRAGTYIFSEIDQWHSTKNIPTPTIFKINYSTTGKTFSSNISHELQFSEDWFFPDLFCAWKESLSVPVTGISDTGIEIPLAENSEYGSALEGFYDRLIRLTLDYARDVQNIENVYLLGSIEEGVFFKWGYRINGKLSAQKKLTQSHQNLIMKGKMNLRCFG